MLRKEFVRSTQPAASNLIEQPERVGLFRNQESQPF
jgi:hypothetical protein